MQWMSPKKHHGLLEFSPKVVTVISLKMETQYNLKISIINAKLLAI